MKPFVELALLGLKIKFEPKGLTSVFIVVALFALSACVQPNWVETLPLCLFKVYSGLDCPGCGLTRGFVAFFHGHFRRAIFYNAMVPVLVLSFTLVAIKACWRSVVFFNGIHSSWTSPQGQKWISRLFCILFLGQWITKLFWHLLH